MAQYLANDPVSYYNAYKYRSLSQIHKMGGQMHGAKRVMAFCILIAVLPATLIIIPLYLRRNVFADVKYPVAESDVLAISEGVSSIFCDALTLHMVNGTTFNAFQLSGEPVLSEKRKHIRLRKSMTLPDDTLEYWGFFLLRGAEVKLRVCSRYPGSRILVVRGEKNLRTCGLLQHNENKVIGATKMDVEHARVNVTFEGPAEHLTDDDVTNTAAEIDENNEIQRHRRSNFDAHIAHGGNAPTRPNNSSGGGGGGDSEGSVSSFENELLLCYDGQILLKEGFPSSENCRLQDVVGDRNTAPSMVTQHQVATDGYYYYIFYSDNDYVSNDIHAVFDIYKPTYRFANTSKLDCVNQSKCHFPIAFWTRDTVIVEVPTRDGIEHEDDDVTLLISTCQPRMAVYVIFPITVLFLILGCAFL